MSHVATGATRRTNPTPWIALALALVTFVLFSPVRKHGFVNYDDDVYLTNNPLIAQGLTWHGVVEASARGHHFMWHPLTSVSQMLDVEMFGLNPGPHHLVSVLLHSISAVLLFLLLQRLTGSVWRAAMVAALFAWHPLRVESVAWASERKDVLCTLFWTLVFWAYSYYAAKPSAARLALCIGTYAMGIMTKPMIITLPCVLLLLDFWPLRRWPAHALLPPAKLFWEKLPLFALSLVLGVMTVVTQKSGDVVMDTRRLPLFDRLANAAVAYVRYLKKMIWPDDLAVFYRLQPWPTWLVILCVLLLVLVSVMAFRRRRDMPFLFTGWFWYLGALVPVIGILQVGSQSMADRYTYVPLIGVFLAIVWGISETASSTWPRRRAILSIAGLAPLICCLWLTSRQLAHWRNSETLFRHAAVVDPKSAVAHNNLGLALEAGGQNAEAERCYERSLAADPGHIAAHLNLGNFLLARGETEQAIAHYQTAARLGPAFAKPRYNLGTALFQRGNTAEAIEHFSAALRLQPRFFEALVGLSTALIAQGQGRDALSYLDRAAALKPDDAAVLLRRGQALTQVGQLDEAMASYEQSLRLDPRQSAAPAAIGDLLARSNRPEEAIPWYRRAIATDPADTGTHNNLGLALAALSRYDEAVASYRESLRLDPENATARNHLAISLLALGKASEALAELQQAIRKSPNYPHAHLNLGILLMRSGKNAEAMARYREALRLKPDFVEAHSALGSALVAVKDYSAAIKHLREANRLRPASGNIAIELSRLLATAPDASLRDGAEALRLAQAACDGAGRKSSDFLEVLALAQAESGRFKDAARITREAIALARSSGETTLAGRLESHLALFESERAYHLPP